MFRPAPTVAPLMLGVSGDDSHDYEQGNVDRWRWSITAEVIESIALTTPDAVSTGVQVLSSSPLGTHTLQLTVMDDELVEDTTTLLLRITECAEVPSLRIYYFCIPVHTSSHLCIQRLHTCAYFFFIQVHTTSSYLCILLLHICAYYFFIPVHTSSSYLCILLLHPCAHYFFIPVHTTSSYLCICRVIGP